MDTLVASSTAQFLAITGFELSDVVEWAGEMVLIILGLGLGLVEALLPWIIAIIVIAVVVRLIYHALKFLHILR